MTKCISAAEQGPRAPVREAFGLLLALLRHIDAGHDDVIFFADEGGSWAIGVPWRSALPAYFRCVAETASSEEFAGVVNQTIANFAEYDRPRLVAAALEVANAEQQAALRQLPARLPDRAALDHLADTL